MVEGIKQGDEEAGIRELEVEMDEDEEDEEYEEEENTYEVIPSSAARLEELRRS